MEIHASAVVDPNARIGRGARIGPFCHVGPDVELGDDVVLHSHVVVEGRTRVGPRTTIFPFACLGHRPQDLKYRGEPTTLTVGADCTLREGVTLHPGTAGGGGETRVGDRCLLLAHAHVGHDCRLGEGVILSNNVMLAGHVSVGNDAILGGGVGVHQFVRVGELAFVGGLSGLEGDLIPFGLALGNRAHLGGLNLVGLRRRGAPRLSIDRLTRMIAGLFGGGKVLARRVEALSREQGDDPYVRKVLTFVERCGSRPLCRPRTGHATEP